MGPLGSSGSIHPLGRATAQVLQVRGETGGAAQTGQPERDAQIRVVPGGQTTAGRGQLPVPCRRRLPYPVRSDARGGHGADPDGADVASSSVAEPAVAFMVSVFMVSVFTVATVTVAAASVGP